MGMFTEYVRLFVLSPGLTVLMRKNGDQWDFPGFEYEDPHPSNLQDAIAKTQALLALDSAQTCLVGVADLLGAWCSQYHAPHGASKPKMALSHLIWIEPQASLPATLPDSWEWKDVQFLATLSADKDYDDAFDSMVAHAVKFLQEDLPKAKDCWQPRHQMGWHKNATEWLTEIVKNQGETPLDPITQFRMNISSTLLKARCADGRAFFLKAPTAGSNEIQITKAVYDLMPQRTLELVDVSTPLGSFVAKEFDTVYRQSEDRRAMSRIMLKALVEMQLESIQHRTGLINRGCPLLGIPELEKAIDTMAHDEDLTAKKPVMMKMVQEGVPKVKELLNSLKQYNIPLTLTHGDFGKRNVGFVTDADGGRRTILFDWQYAAVSHPFFDFHDYDKEDFTDELIEEYLHMWIEFEPIERCRDAFKIGTAMGWALKMLSSVEYTHVPTPELNSEMLDWFWECWQCLEVRTNIHNEADRH